MKIVEAFEYIPKLIFEKYKVNKYFILTDENIYKFYCKKLETLFMVNNKNILTKILKSGEVNKNRENIN